MSGYEPRFDRDYETGLQGELLTDYAIESLRDGQARTETKTKRRKDDWIYVELMQDPGGTGECWKDSGLNVTTAEWWVFVIDGTGVMLWFPTDLLRWAIRVGEGKPKAERDGDNPTEGRLLRVSRLIQAIPQWLESQS